MGGAPALALSEMGQTVALGLLLGASVGMGKHGERWGVFLEASVFETESPVPLVPLAQAISCSSLLSLVPRQPSAAHPPGWYSCLSLVMAVGL